MEGRAWPARIGAAAFGLLAAAGVLAATLPGPGPAPAYAVQPVPLAPPAPTPPPAPSQVRQLVSVVAAGPWSTTARLTLWQRRTGTSPWQQVGPAVTVRLGRAGLTRHPREGQAATPLGSYSLTRAFGRDSNAEQLITRMPYHRLRPGDGWSTAAGRGYNRLGHSGELWAGRNTWARAAVLIDYNVAHPRAGAGSGFFVHVAAGGPTRGCVGLPRRAMFRLLRWRDPAAHPRIVISVRR